MHSYRYVPILTRCARYIKKGEQNGEEENKWFGGRPFGENPPQRAPMPKAGTGDFRTPIPRSWGIWGTFRKAAAAELVALLFLVPGLFPSASARAGPQEDINTYCDSVSYQFMLVDGDWNSVHRVVLICAVQYVHAQYIHVLYVQAQSKGG